MTLETRSEHLFDVYCEDRGYTSTPIPAGSDLGKTPDRLVEMPSGQIVAEIKELTPNADDVRQFRELREQKWTHGGGTPGARVFEHIRRAAPQLKAHAWRGVPCCLVLYDNIVLEGERIGNTHLSSSFIDFGMYGLQTVILASESQAPDARLVAAGSGRGPRRQMSEDSRVHVSAVLVLREAVETGAPFLLVYHNFYARLPLPSEAFRGPRDRHLVKPAHPNDSPQLWTELEV